MIEINLCLLYDVLEYASISGGPTTIDVSQVCEDRHWNYNDALWMLQNAYEHKLLTLETNRDGTERFQINLEGDDIMRCIRTINPEEDCTRTVKARTFFLALRLIKFQMAAIEEERRHLM